MKTINFITGFLFLALFVNAGTITVTSPNGTEVWAGCTSHTITWTWSGVSNNYSIDYSTDSGATWISLTSGLYITNGQYEWTVPNTSSTLCLVRVMDSSEPATYDISNAIFSITAPLIVTSPNGSESWQAGTTKTITWVATGTSNYYDIKYSVNAGSSWTDIATNSYITSSQYSWTVPNNPSSSCLVKILDYYNTSCIVDVSDNLFTIAPPTPVITVTNPNTSTTWYVGSSQTITWTSQYVTSNTLKIDYSTNNGSTWIPVATNTENDGSYSWTVPNTPSTQCLVKITDLGNPSTYDVSNSLFIIAAPSITITSPNGGEVWATCSSHYITWNSSGVSNNYSIDYSTDSCATWVSVTSGLYITTGQYNWTIPNTPSTVCFVRVTDSGNPSATDISNAKFTIVINTDIVITSPNGGESWQGNSSHNITWATAPTSTRWAIYYSINNGSTWTTITSNTTTKPYAWTVPNSPSATCLIKIVDYNNTCIYDISDSVFTIIPPTPYITVTAPNTGVTLYSGNSTNITWNSGYLTSSFVVIEYSTNNGSTWNTIASVTENDGTYSWTVPNTPSTQCKVRISEYNNPSTYDVSDVTFTIANPYITLTAPNGGENLTGCYSKTITWNSAGVSGTFTLKYSVNNGSSWSNIVSSTTGSSYNWSVLPNVSSANCLVKIYDYNNQAIADSSDAVFNLNLNSDIIITNPNGGETWAVASSQTINWTSTSTNFNVYYSVNNGSTWNTLTTNTSVKTYNWTIPNNPSANCLIKVEDYSNTCKYDLSNSTFTIPPPTPVLTVTSPNTAVTWYIGNNYNITWSTQYVTSSYVIIEYSVNNGSIWTTIINPTENDGTYSWNVPNAPSAQCLIKITAYDNPAITDMSNVNFTIAMPYIIVTAPIGGESWKGCSSKSVTWTSAGTSGYYTVKYTTNGGSSWTTLISNTTSTSYTWNPVPSVNSSDCYIKVYDYNNSAYKDSSDAAFTLVKNTDIAVTAPNGT
ncbi:MAG: hypothetical protein HY738_01445, partial [Bacteroidia bacterium]|nr:hypothetical protein [Bacteroidia bacterium]